MRFIVFLMGLQLLYPFVLGELSTFSLLKNLKVDNNFTVSGIESISSKCMQDFIDIDYDTLGESLSLQLENMEQVCSFGKNVATCDFAGREIDQAHIDACVNSNGDIFPLSIVVSGSDIELYSFDSFILKNLKFCGGKSCTLAEVSEFYLAAFQKNYPNTELYNSGSILKFRAFVLLSSSLFVSTLMLF